MRIRLRRSDQGPMITGKLTTKAQTTIPQPVRAALRRHPGDELIYEISDQRVTLTKASRGSKTDDPFRTFHEWKSEADTKAYRKFFGQFNEWNRSSALDASDRRDLAFENIYTHASADGRRDTELRQSADRTINCGELA